ncbi:hypothetical protein FB389_0381 [Rarobacter incanus]|uniref:Uncharacterized protein n=1 Tax=Rarobacter incanus TaxID=153494 RepID=A0A542SNB2_9MICO|nr:hypothetical protein FB389_0381 [Rarobacter incanus]
MAGISKNWGPPVVASPSSQAETSGRSLVVNQSLTFLTVAFFAKYLAEAWNFRVTL